jgi:two-component system sensor histidine kinase AlgZ
VRPRSARSALAATLFREALVCLAVGAPALAFVLGTNRSAPAPLVALHAALLGAFAPLAVATLELAVPRRAQPGLGAVLREIGVRTLGLGVATAGMLGVIAVTTPLSLRVLVGGPLLVGLVPVYLAYALVGLGVEWAGLQEHALRAEAAEARARQAALAARIRPHFLFNALNCIEELTDTDPPAAREAVGRLARLLRAVLASSASPLGPLEREARLVEDYLGIEQIRFGARFSYALRVAPEAAGRLVPATVLLTLAENAVKHGVEQVPGPVHIALEALLEPGDRLRIRLSGPAAPGPAASAEPSAGYGLADVRERLALAYAGRASFALDRSQEGESHVELIVPG